LGLISKEEASEKSNLFKVKEKVSLPHLQQHSHRN
jgi:hypothetical protein